MGRRVPRKRRGAGEGLRRKDEEGSLEGGGAEEGGREESLQKRGEEGLGKRERK